MFSLKLICHMGENTDFSQCGNPTNKQKIWERGEYYQDKVN